MATWESLRRYIKSTYKVADDDLDQVRLIFSLSNDRSQVVFVTKQMLGDDEWAEIWTPVCNETDVSHRDALLRNSKVVVGALALTEGGHVIFRHSLPLKDLDLDEFEVPFHLVINFGDMLEQEFTGADKY